MSKSQVEKVFLNEQFNDVLDILLDNNVINQEQHRYYEKLYYNAKTEEEIDNLKEDFISNVIDKM